MELITRAEPLKARELVHARRTAEFMVSFFPVSALGTGWAGSQLHADPDILLMETIASRQKADVNWRKREHFHGGARRGVLSTRFPISFYL